MLTVSPQVPFRPESLVISPKIFNRIRVLGFAVGWGPTRRITRGELPLDVVIDPRDSKAGDLRLFVKNISSSVLRLEGCVLGKQVHE